MTTLRAHDCYYSLHACETCRSHPQAGWSFTSAANGINALANHGEHHRCNEDSFHFYRNGAGVARLRTRPLQGSGCAVISFSNCWVTPQSFVGVYLNNRQVRRTITASPSPVVTVRFTYTAGQVLEIRDEGANAVAEIESLTFLPSCTAPPTTAPTPAPTGWYQNPNVPDNNVIYSRLQSAEAQLVAMNRTLMSNIRANAGYTGQLLLGQESLATLQNSTSVALSSTIQGIRQNISDLSQSISTTVSSSINGLSSRMDGMVSVLQAAVSSAASSATANPSTQPAIASSGTRISVVSGQCAASDLCGAANFAAALQQALSNL